MRQRESSTMGRNLVSSSRSTTEFSPSPIRFVSMFCTLCVPSSSNEWSLVWALTSSGVASTNGDEGGFIVFQSEVEDSPRTVAYGSSRRPRNMLEMSSVCAAFKDSRHSSRSRGGERRKSVSADLSQGVRGHELIGLDSLKVACCRQGRLRGEETSVLLFIPFLSCSGIVTIVMLIHPPVNAHLATDGF